MSKERLDKRRDICATSILHKKNISRNGERYKKNREEDEKYVLNYTGSSVTSNKSKSYDHTSSGSCSIQ